MADIKDKIITAESLSALHEYNENTYETKENVEEKLANLFANGMTVLSSYQYGDELPEAGTVGRIFFKRVIDESTDA